MERSKQLPFPITTECHRYTASRFSITQALRTRKLTCKSLAEGMPRLLMPVGRSSAPLARLVLRAGLLSSTFSFPVPANLPSGYTHSSLDHRRGNVPTAESGFATRYSVNKPAKVVLGRVPINASTGRMSAFGANRTRRDGGNDANDPKRTWVGLKSRSAVGLPQCYLPLRSTGEIAGETARLHHAARRRGDGVPCWVPCRTGT